MLVPACIVAGVFGVSTSGYTLAFVVIGFVGTMIGCLAAVLILRRKLHRIHTAIIAGLSVAVGVVLIAIHPTMPSWPFTSIVAAWAWWLIVPAGLMSFAILGASQRYA